MADSPDLVSSNSTSVKSSLSINAIVSSTENAIALELVIEDQEVVVELKKYPDGSARVAFRAVGLADLNPCSASGARATGCRNAPKRG